MPEPDDAPVRLRLDLAYDGTGFSGWARQAGERRTVQGVLEDAVSVALGRLRDPAPRLVVAGRTDAGVHATGQVAHLDIGAAQLDAAVRRGGVEGLARRLTGILVASGAPDVVVHRVAAPPPGFDARFSAGFRRYRYRIADRIDHRDPLERPRAPAHPVPLDEAWMQRAADAVLGLHDFASFCRPRPFATTIRTLEAFTWSRDDTGVLVAEVRADAFCHNMVRALVGAGVAVGSGRLEPDRMRGLLAARERTNAFAVAPAHGLTLVEVGYPDAAGLAAQAERARARREVPDPTV